MTRGVPVKPAFLKLFISQGPWEKAGEPSGRSRAGVTECSCRQPLLWLSQTLCLWHPLQGTHPASHPRLPPRMQIPAHHVSPSRARVGAAALPVSASLAGQCWRVVPGVRHMDSSLSC